jgi:hypothetical protein
MHKYNIVCSRKIISTLTGIPPNYVYNRLIIIRIYVKYILTITADRDVVAVGKVERVSSI